MTLHTRSFFVNLFLLNRVKSGPSIKTTPRSTIKLLQFIFYKDMSRKIVFFMR